MLRGGAFNNNPENVRCAYRNDNNPDNRNNNIGFRVVVSTFFASGNAWRGFVPFQDEENGVVCSWSRPHIRGAGQIATLPLPGNPGAGALSEAVRLGCL